MTRVVLIDGPLPPDHPALATRELLRPGGGAHAVAHAAAMAEAMLAGCPEVRFVNLAVFGEGLSTDAATVVRALDRALETGAMLVLCAFGMARPEPEIRRACAALRAAGAVVVASSPARGPQVWPAAFCDVVAVQGDARCAPGEWSHLALDAAEFGACPALPGAPDLRGASVAAAHFAGLLAGRAAGGDIVQALEEMRRSPDYRGRERRG